MRPAVAEAFVEFPLSLVYVIDHEVRVRFSVERRYAGRLGDDVWVNTGDFPGFDCESPMRFSGRSQRWLVFAHEAADGELHVSDCMQPYGEAEQPEAFADSLAELGPGETEPNPDAAWSSYRGRAPWRTSLVLLLAAVAWLWTRRRSRRPSSWQQVRSRLQR